MNTLRRNRILLGWLMLLLTGFQQIAQGATVYWAIETNTGSTPAAPTFSRTSGGTTQIGTATATMSTTSDVITVTSTTGLTVGQTVTGTGMPAGATITQIISPTQFRISANATTNTTTGTVNASNAWTTTGLNWSSVSPAASLTNPGTLSTWVNGDSAVFGINTGNSAFNVNLGAAGMQVGGLTFMNGTAGSGIVLTTTGTVASPAGSIVLTGATPTITLGHGAATANHQAQINMPLSGTNGMTVVTASPTTFTGRLMLGSTTPSSNYANTLTGGITVGNKTTIDAQVATGANNPLGTNKITLQAGAGLDLTGLRNNTQGLSGRIFDLPAFVDTSRVDFTQTATGETLPGRTFLTTGNSGQNVITVANTATLAIDQPLSGVGIPDNVGAKIGSIVNGTQFTVVDASGAPLNLTQTDPTVTIGSRLATSSLGLGPTVQVSSLQGDTLTAIRYIDPSGVTQTQSNYAVQYVGTVNITSNGTYTFFARVDDGARIYIDGVLVLNNDGSKGSTDLSSAPISLGAGTHDIRVDYVQGTGGGLLDIAYAGTGSGTANQRTSLTSRLRRAEVLTAAGASSAIQVGNDVQLTGSASINIRNQDSPSIQMGALQLNTGVTLTSRAVDLSSTPVEIASGADGFTKTLRFGGTTVNPSILGDTTGGAGTVNINANIGVAFDGVVSDQGRNMTLVKTGIGRLFFTNSTSANVLGTGTIIEMQGTTSGKLANAAYSSGTSTIALNNTTGLTVGMSVSGTAIPAGAFITAISGNNITLSRPANGAGISGTPLTMTATPALVLTGGSAAGSFNPIGSATIRLNAGNLILDSNGANSAGFGATFANNIQVTNNASIQSIFSNGTLTLGNTSNTLAISPGRSVVLDAVAGGLPVGDAGATLRVLSQITGDSTTTLTLRSTVMNAGTTVTAAEAGELALPQRTGNANVTRGTVTLAGNNSGFLGTLVFEPEAGLRVEGVNALNGRTFSLNRLNTLSLLEDGDGTGSQQSFNFNHNITVNQTNTVAVGRIGTVYSPYFAQAVNKTSQINTLTIGQSTLTVANNNSSRLQVTGATTLTGSPSFSINNATDSGLLPGLQLTGIVSGNASLQKVGGGTLTLDNASNSFGGAIASFNVFGASGGSTLTAQDVSKFVVGQTIAGTGIGATARVSSVNVQTFNTVAASSTNVLYMSNNPVGVFAVGMPVSGSGVPTGTTVSAVSDNITTATTGNAGQNLLTMTSNSTFRVGQPVFGTGIPAGAYVIEVVGTNQIRLSQDVTALNPTLVRRAVTLSQVISSADSTLVLSQLNLSTPLTATPSTATSTAIIRVAGGVLAVPNDGALGAATNVIYLDTNAATGSGLRVTGTFGTTRAILLNQANNAIEVTQGNTFTLNTAFTPMANGNSLRKNDIGTLVLNQSQGTWGGQLVVGQGSLRIDNLAALGASGSNVGSPTPRTIIADTGAELVLNQAGTNSINETFQVTLTNGRNIGGINSLGAIRNALGTNTLNNPVHLAVNISNDNNNQAVVAGVDNGTSLTLGGGVRFTWNSGGSNQNIIYGLSATGTGVGTLAQPFANISNSPLTATLNKLGSGTWNITAASALTPNFSATTTSGNDVVTLGSTTGLFNGLNVEGPNIPVGATITQIISDTQVRISAPATGTGSAMTSFGSATGSGIGALNIAQGTLGITNAGSLSGTGTVSMNPATTLNLDNTAQNVNSRLAGRALTLFGADVNLTGNSAAATLEQTGTVTFGRGDSVITLTPNASQSLKLVLGTSAVVGRTVGATVLFRGTNLGAAEGNGVATIAGPSDSFGFNMSAGAVGQTGGTGAVNKSIVPWALVDTSAGGSGISFATMDTAAGIATSGDKRLRPLAANEFIQTTQLDASVSLANVYLNAQPTLAANRTINSLTLQSGGGVNVVFPFNLTLDSGGLLALTGNTGITGSGVLSVGGNRDLVVHALANTNITTVISGTSGGLTKSGAGTLTLGALNGYTGTTSINQGILKLAPGATNSIYFNNLINIHPGATLDLNGGVQFASGVGTDIAVAAQGGTASIINTGVSQATLVSGATGVNWSGVISGNIAVVRGGNWNVRDAQTYTGPTFILGGTTQLDFDGALSNTSAITVSRGVLGLQNTTTYASNNNNRINDAAPITLQGARLFYQGRWATNSTETVGAITLGAGQSLIDVFNSGVNVASAQLTAASLTQSPGSRATLNMRGINGQAGSNSRFMVTAPLTLNNHLIANAAGQTGWAVLNREWATYSSATGIGQLDAAGYAGYAPNPNNTINTGGATDNLRVSMAAINATGLAGTTLLTVGTTAGMQVGDTLDGLGLAPGTTIVQVANGTQVVLSQPLTLNDPVVTIGQTLTSNRVINTLNLNTSRGTFLDLNGNTLRLTGGGIIASQTSDNSGNALVLSSPDTPSPTDGL